MAARRPTVFSETVLPPVLGPVINNARKSKPASTSIGTTDFWSISGCLARTNLNRVSRTCSPVVDRTFRRMGRLARQREAVFRFREKEIDLCQRAERHVDIFSFRPEGHAESEENAVDLMLFSRAGFSPTIVEIDDFHRFHEQGLPTRRRVMDHTRHLRPRIRAHRNHIASVTGSDNRILKRASIPISGNNPIEPFHQAIVGEPDFAPNPGQFF